MFLCALMWKHGVVRVKRYLHTPIEIMSTVLFLSFLFLVRGLFQQDWEVSTDLLSVMDTSSTPSLVFYTPVTDNTRALMKKAGDKLELQELRKVPDYPETSGYYGVGNLREIGSFVEAMGKSDALVLFQDIQDFKPNHLNYTIRIKFKIVDQGHSDTTAGLYEPFFRLRWALDQSYQEMRTSAIARTRQNTTRLSGDPPTLSWAVAMVGMVSFCNSLALMLPFVFLVCRAVEERLSGHWELLKMSGVSMCTIFASHMLNVLPTGLFFCFVGCAIMKVTDTPMIPTTEYIYLVLPHFLYFYSLMVVAMVASFFLNKTTYASATAVLLYLVLQISDQVCKEFKMPENTRIFTVVIPTVPISWVYSELAELEFQKKGITLDNMMYSHTKSSICVGWSLVWMPIQIVVLALLVLVLSRVRPGPYGMRRTCVPWIKRKKLVDPLLEQLEPTTSRDPQYFEEPPELEVGISIKNVTKIYRESKVHALSHVTFDVYNGEILVLLGHNGAGKTTLMSIISGMLPATAGKVFINGHDIFTDTIKGRKAIGLCTQHEMFMPYLSSIDHVRFFTMLKGQSILGSEIQAIELLEEVKIIEKAYFDVQELSGGMRRRLQLACALAGGSTVLVLDEPTSGLDIETRREIWDLLLTLRGKRTVVLTTHYMEEADALGDRVAVLHEGVLRCHATPMYLKQNIGTGYLLTLLTHGAPNVRAITPIVTSSVDHARLRERGLNHVTYDLPARNTAQFPGLFLQLEEQQFELGVESIDVGMPTLEEVFLRLCSNWETNLDNEYLSEEAVETYKRLSGCALKKRQFLVLIKRHVYYMLDSKWMVLLWLVVLPISLIFTMTFLSYKPPKELVTKASRLSDKTLTLDLMKAGALRTQDNTTDGRDDQGSRSYVEFPLKTTEVTLNANNYNSDGIDLYEVDAKVKLKTRVFNEAPHTLSLVSNINTVEQDATEVQTRNTAQDDLRSDNITFLSQDNIGKTIQLPDSTAVLYWAMIIVIIHLSLVASASSLPNKERQTGARHIYLMAGCSVTMFWATRLLFFYLFYCLVLFVPTLVALVAFSGSRVIWTPEAMGVLWLVFSCGMCAWLCLVFLLSLWLSQRATTTLTIALTFVFGLLVTFVIGTADTKWQTGGVTRNVMSVLEYTQTPVSFGVAMFKTSDAALANAYCDLNRHLCPLVVPINPPFSYIKCCQSNERPVEYFSFDKFAPLPHIISMAVQFILLLALLLGIQRGWFDINWRSKKNRTLREDFEDPLVNAEKTYVKDTIAKPVQQIKDVMLVKELHKRFICRKNPAVRGVSFSVKPGECFGVLGVNGAGKTTTLRMIVGEISASYGKTFANSYFLRTNRREYLQSLGYCPQYSGLDLFMTGYQNLRTLLTLRGLKERDVQRETASCLDRVGLHAYRNKKVLGYSGGCLRRLAAGAALSIGAAVTLLDEPTAGVDVTARRRIWACIQRVLLQHRAVIITSHSMDEMEALCHRLAILSGGAVRALGAPAALRAQHAAGHAVVLKLAPSPPDHMLHRTGTSPILQLKSEMKRIFNCTLKDEHLTMVNYHINDKMKNSELFTKLEELKAKFEGFVEDYSVSATTLEEVFLAFAQESQDLSDRSSSCYVPVE